MGIFADEVEIGERKINGSQLKWSVFHDFPAGQMYSVVQEWVFPFIKNLHGDKNSAYSKYMDDAIFKIPTPLLLSKIVDSLDEDQRPAVSGAIADLEDAIAQTEASSASVQSAVGDARSALDGMQSQLDDADTALQGSVDALSANAKASQALMQGLGVAAAQTKGLSEGLAKAGAGFEKLQEGVQQMSTALTQVSEGAKKLDKASSQLGKGVEEALDMIRSSIDAKIDLVNALSDYVSAKPAFGGSVADMPANTLYIVRAKAESTPLR